MKFKCADCAKVFLYPAKIRTILTPQVKPGQIIQLPPLTGYEPTIEEHRCPYCQSRNLLEFAEPFSTEKIVSVISVEIAEVDAKLKEGYEVKELYAKTAILIKKETTKE